MPMHDCFLIAPELSFNTDEFKTAFGLNTVVVREHDNLAPRVDKQEHNEIDKIKSAILSIGNLFTVENDHTNYNI